MKMGEILEVCGCADKKIDFAQIVKLFEDSVVGEDRVKARVVRLLVKRHVEVLN